LWGDREITAMTAALQAAKHLILAAARITARLIDHRIAAVALVEILEIEEQLIGEESVAGNYLLPWLSPRSPQPSGLQAQCPVWAGENANANSTNNNINFFIAK
jgi:hypothetical protein